MRKHRIVLIVLFFFFAGSHAMAQDTPKVELFGGYSYVRTNLVTPQGCCFNMNGGSGSVAFNANNWFGIAADVGGYHTGNVNSSGLDLTVISYLFGPRFSYRKGERFTPFAQALVGGGHAGGTLYTGTSSTGPGVGPNNAFAMTAGGGLDVKLGPHVAVRLVQAEYFFARFLNGKNDRQNNLRVSAGIVFRFGGR